MSSNFDIVIIGSGPGGYVAAIRAAQLGFSVACIEKEKTLGGTCLNIGCIPSKALLDSSNYFYQANTRYISHGIHIQDISFNVSEMLQRKEKIISGLTNGVTSLFKLNKVESILGNATINKDGNVTVTNPDGSKLSLTSENIIIATGSKPIALRAAICDDKNIVTSTGALNFKQVPETLGIIGAGAIGLELGSVWSRLGSKVIILEALEDFLPAADKQISSEALKILSKQGLDIKLGASVERSEVISKKVEIEYSDNSGSHQIKVEKLIVAAGRKPEIKNLLEPGIELDIDEKGFIKVNDVCETNVNGIYAIGDVVRGPMLAHKASEEGIMVAENIYGEGGEVDYDRIPSVIYTHPEIAWAGLNEEESESQGFDIQVGSFPFQASGRAMAANETEGFVKIIANSADDSILGVHVIGPSAADIVQQGIIAMQLESSAEDLSLIMFSHPSYSEALHEAALALRGNAIHIANKKR